MVGIATWHDTPVLVPLTHGSIPFVAGRFHLPHEYVPGGSKIVGSVYGVSCLTKEAGSLYTYIRMPGTAQPTQAVLSNTQNQRSLAVHLGRPILLSV